MSTHSLIKWKVIQNAIWLLFAIIAFGATAASGQTCKARMDQDSTLNNLIHPDGYETCRPGDLGPVVKVGMGPKDMILIAGAGFGGDIFDSFMSSRQLEYTMHAVTLPGNAGSPAPPMPPEGTSYAEGTWIRSAEQGILNLIDSEEMHQPIIIAHWYFSTLVALRLALDHPDIIGGVVIVSGVSRAETADPVNRPLPETLAERADYIDKYMAPKWFKTVMYDTWHDNNWRPMDYARHPLDQLLLWRQAAEPPLPVWIRFLCEVWAQDITEEFNKLAVPTLILKPGFDQSYRDANPQSYLIAFTHRCWEGVENESEFITVETIEDSRIFIMHDQPEKLDQAINKFIAGLKNDRPVTGSTKQ